MTIGDVLLQLVLVMGALLTTGFVLSALAALVRWLAGILEPVMERLVTLAHVLVGPRRW